MKNTFGQSVAVTLFGESHGPMIGAVLDGLAPGVRVDEDLIRMKLALRRGGAALSTARREADPFQIVSGIFEGRTTGTPLCIVIPNGDTHSADYAAMRSLMRPSHADYTAYCKYHGFQDYRGGGHFSGRVTAALVAVGAVAEEALREGGICLGTHLLSCADVRDREFGSLEEDIAALSGKPFPVLDEAAGEKMQAEILRAREEGDSVGGVLETAVVGLPAGVGEPWFDTVEGVLAHILFSVPAVKGVEFGGGFRLAALRGSRTNDPMRVEIGQIVTETNFGGGIAGGITNGMPLLFRCAVKPTPSISLPQRTVNIETMENAELSIRGRHDPCIAHRARAVIDAVTAIALCDLMSQRFGTDGWRKNP